tara:strand:+ start:710 stop:904 length:195 start_codon:yes stop_codon:yes gene_type:complete
MAPELPQEHLLPQEKEKRFRKQQVAAFGSIPDGSRRKKGVYLLGELRKETACQFTRAVLHSTFG